MLKKHEVNRFEACSSLLPSHGGRLLDIGCGDGDFLFLVGPRFKECYGVDVSPERVRKAQGASSRMTSSDVLDFRQGDVDEKLDFDDEFFDAVSCMAVLEHTVNPPRVLGEICRILKPNGFLVLEVPNIAWLPYRMQSVFGSLPKTGGEYLGADWEHLHNFTRSVLTGLLEEEGFNVGNVTCSGILAKYRRFWITLLASDLVVLATRK